MLNAASESRDADTGLKTQRPLDGAVLHAKRPAGSFLLSRLPADNRFSLAPSEQTPWIRFNSASTCRSPAT